MVIQHLLCYEYSYITVVYVQDLFKLADRTRGFMKSYKLEKSKGGYVQGMCMILQHVCMFRHDDMISTSVYTKLCLSCCLRPKMEAFNLFLFMYFVLFPHFHNT